MWSLYAYGEVKVGGQTLSSNINRIDLGPKGMITEGRMERDSRDKVNRFDSVHNALLAMIVERLRFVFDAWPNGSEPNALQLTSIKQGPHGEVLGNHYDHRDRWGNWIATVAWMRCVGSK